MPPKLKKKEPGVADLVKQAEAALDSFEHELALQFYKRALSKDPTNADVLEATGSLLADMGDLESAKDLLRKSIDADPVGSFNKYMLMAQLLQGMEAIATYDRGIQLLKADLTKAMSGEGGEPSTVRKSLASALTAAAEVYLADMPEDARAEQEAEKLLLEAIQCGESLTAEPYQALASMRLNQERREEALTLMGRTLEIMEALGGEGVPEEKREVAPYAFRKQTAKLLIHLADFDRAEGVLEDLLEENDEDAESYYLLGVCCKDAGEPDYAIARDNFTKCKELLEKLASVDPRIMEDVETQLAETAELLAKHPPPADGDGMEDDGPAPAAVDSDEEMR
eukprot:tig00021127_g18833.t1